jgi:hypothetical protein
MATRTATCRCGQLKATCDGEPIRVSVCHCLACQKRTGSAFGAQARRTDEQVTITGESRVWLRTDDNGNKVIYRFCQECGSTIAYVIDDWPGATAIPVGAFADPSFPAPKFSVREDRKHDWVTVSGADLEHSRK